MAMLSINPATEELLASFDELCDDEVTRKLETAEERFHRWRQTSFAHRSELMLRAAARLREQKTHYGTILTREMGKLIGEAEAEVEKCAWVCEYYAENAERFMQDEPVQTEAFASYVAFDPIGPVLAVMPWNFPFWQVFRFAAPALMAGNIGLLKHASNVPQSALAIEEVFVEAGFPEGCFQTLLIGSSKVARVIRDPRVKAVTLTGSDPAGRQVAGVAGSEIKKSVLELGGSDPFIVLGDADLSAATTTAVTARMINNGQSCIAAKRFIVVKAVAAEFLERFRAIMAERRIGDPMDRTVGVGPLARQDLVAELADQVSRSLAAGGTVVLGGGRPDRKGYFYEPTIVSNAGPGQPVYEEETFGPVAAVIEVGDADEAVRVANDSPFGLGASLWTGDLDRARTLARRIEAGCVFVNEMVKSDPRLPFGGVKLSGYGRELSAFGLREFVNIKTVFVK